MTTHPRPHTADRPGIPAIDVPGPSNRPKPVAAGPTPAAPPPPSARMWPLAAVGDEVRPGDAVGGRLREVAGLLEGRDRLMGRVASLLIDVQHADGLHERLGGMTLQVWLEHVCRIPGADARALLGAVDVLGRMPSLVVGLCDRCLSWPQAAAICRAARRVPVGRLPELDELAAAAMIDMAAFEPDALVADVWQWVDALQPSRLEQVERARDRSEFVSLAPNLFGGGSLFGELGTVSFATVAEALDAGLTPPGIPARSGLDGVDDEQVDAMFDTLDDHRRAHTRDHGTAMAARLVDLCERALTGDRPGGAGRARPLLLATIDADALLDATRTPGWLLHTLTGGHMKVSAATLQRLVDERGADLRGIALDTCGQVVGVGRTTQVPPHWLRHAIWARDLAVSDPNGSCPIRRADLDHIVAWPHGPTDVTNLHPVGRTWHNHKTTTNWTVTRHDDGTTQWRHRRHGWTLRLAPPRRNLASPPADPASREQAPLRSPPGSTRPPGESRNHDPSSANRQASLPGMGNPRAGPTDTDRRVRTRSTTRSRPAN